MTQARTAAFGHHGGRLDEARAAFPDAPRPWLDLSTGINPCPWRPASPQVHDPAPLPCRTALHDLEAMAAAHFGVSPMRVAAVPGTEIALRLLPSLGLPRPLVAVPPCYGTHAAVADRMAGPGEGDDAGTLLLANPNNPDGRRTAPPALHALAGRRAAAGGWLVVDEAFADAVAGHSLLPGLDPAAPVVVLRSFGKFFGLAGLRLGFVVAPPPVVARVRALTGDWPVTAEALGLGTAAYADRAWIAGTRETLRRGAAGLDALLARHGLAATGACPLFRLVEHPGAGAIFTRLARAGILTRPFTDHPDWLRFGLPGDDAAFDRLDRALADG